VSKRTFWIIAIVLVLGGAWFRSFVSRPEVAHAITVGAIAEVDREAGLTPPAARQPPAQPPASPALPPYVPPAAAGREIATLAHAERVSRTGFVRWKCRYTSDRQPFTVPLPIPCPATVDLTDED
jgi:hypothetical protein